MQDPLFVVSTGRCGSNLVSRVLRAHPHILSVSDFLTNTRPSTFAHESFDGPQLWELLDTPYLPATLLMRNGLPVEEFLYPASDTSRFSAQTGIPGIALATLPHLTDDPDGLYDALREYVRTLPRDSLGRQYTRVFEWLRERFGKRVWIERSGGTLGFIPELLRHFPKVRFIHLYRDGRECAMSMSRHHVYRVGLGVPAVRSLFGFQGGAEPGAPGTTLPREQLAQITLDRAEYDALELPPSRFGKLWSDWVVDGVAQLRQVPQERVLDLCYERLLAEPEAELRKLHEFTLPGLDPSEWLAEVVPTVRTKPPTWIDLPAEERSRLEQACAPGLRQLGYA